MDRERADRLVSLHAAREAALKRDLAEVLGRVNAARRQLAALRRALAAQRSLPPAQLLTGADLARAEAYAERLRAEAQVQQQLLAQAEQQAAQLREQLTAAARERMAAETVLEREQRAMAARAVAHEQHEVDDSARRHRMEES